MIEKFAGINQRLENVLQDRKEQPVVEKEKETTDTKNPEPPAKTEEPKILKGLKGLPPALLQTISTPWLGSMSPHLRERLIGE